MREKIKSGISKEKYQALLESINEGFCIIKVLFDENEKPVDYRFLEVNSAFEKQTGLVDAEGKRMRELAPDQEDYWFDLYGRVALTSEPVRFEQAAEALNRYYEVFAFPFGKPSDREVAIFFKDITQRKENEFSNAWLGAIIDSSNDAIISKDLDGIITSWNRSAERLFGYTAEEAIGRNVTLIFPEERLDEEVEILKRIKRGERIDHFETVRECKGGSRLNISLTISPIKNSDDEIIGISKIARDITKQKKVEKELRELNGTLEERVEKRTEELQAYQFQLRALASELSKAEEKERNRLATELHNNLGQMLSIANMYIESIQQSDLSAQLSDKIADLSEVLSNAHTYTRELMTELKPPPALDKEELREVLDWVAQKMEKYDLEVYIKEDEQPKPLTKERRLVLYQCVRELFMNIVKYAGVNEARLVLSRHNNFVRVTVEDEGKGFNVNEKNMMPTKEGGFGLFNIREQMEWIGGRFKLISEPGKGTKATLYVPAKEWETSEVPGKEVEK